MQAYSRLKGGVLASLLTLLLIAPVSGNDVSKIQLDPAIQDAFARGERPDVIVDFSGRPDLSAAFELRTRADRAGFVYNALSSHADAVQDDARTLLQSFGRVESHLTDPGGYMNLWLTNSIAVAAITEAEVDALVNAPGVISIAVQEVFPPLPEPEPAPEPFTPEPSISQINAPDVWAMGITGTGITVSNTDAGVRHTHEALVNQYRGNTGGGFDHNHHWFDPYQFSGTPRWSGSHGTHVMGTSVGRDAGGVNEIGVAPGADWIACIGFGGAGGGATNAGLIACNQFSIAPTDTGGNNPNPSLAAHVVNNSWGGTLCNGAYNDWFQATIDASVAAGIIPVFAMGNASNCGLPSNPPLGQNSSPSNYGTVFSVGSSSNTGGSYAPHSIKGPTVNSSPGLPDYPDHFGFADLKPQVVAPGVSIRSSVTTSDTAYQSTGWTGTSMSAPAATGLVALMWQAAPCLIGDYATTGTIIMQTANPIPVATGSPSDGPGNIPNQATGWGEIDALAAVNAAAAECGDPGTIEGTVTRSDTTGPVEDVEIVAVGAVTRATTTLPDGTYELEAPEGTYDVTASLTGFYPETVTGVIVTESGTVTVDFELDPAPIANISTDPIDFLLEEGNTDSETLTITNDGDGDLTWTIVTDEIVSLPPGTRSHDPALDEDIAIPDFTLTGGSDSTSFTLPAGVATSGEVVGFSFEGTIAGVSGNGSWASDMCMIIEAPDGTTYGVGGISGTDPACGNTNSWDFQGGGSGSDGTYNSSHDDVFAPPLEDAGDWIFTFVDDWSSSTATMDWTDVTVTLHKQPLPFCIDPVTTADWLSATPDAGTTTGGGFTDVDVEADSTGLANGSYQAALCIETNDPDNALIVVPVNLEVTGPLQPPAADITPASFDFTVAEDSTDDDVLNIGNAGELDLDWSIGEAEPAGVRGIVLLEEDFTDETFPPAGWSQYWLEGGGTIEWERWTSNSNSPPASARRRFGGSGDGFQDDWLVTPPLALTGAETLSFIDAGQWMNDYVYSGIWASIGSCDPEDGDFVEVAEIDDTPGPSGTVTWRGEDVVIDLSAFSGSTCLAFRYSGDFAHTWHIDDVVVASGGGGTGCASPTDAPWLSVSPDNGTTPGGDSVPVTVSVDSTGLALGDYDALLCVTTNDTGNPLVEVPVGMTVTDGLGPIADITPASFDFTVDQDDSDTDTLNIGNIGDLTLEWTIETAETTALELFRPSRAVQKELGPGSRTSIVSAAKEEHRIVNIRLRGGDPVSVLVVSPDTVAPSNLVSDLNAFPDVDADLFTDPVDTITVGDMLPYDVVMTTNNNEWAPVGGSDVIVGDALADYIDAGGKVVVFNYAYDFLGWELAGRFIDEDYGPFELATSDAAVAATMNVLEPGHALFDGVTSVSYDTSFRLIMALQPGAELLAEWSDGLPMIAVNDDVAAFNLLYSAAGDPGGWTGDVDVLTRNAAIWLTGGAGDPEGCDNPAVISWLSVDPDNGTTPAGGNVPVDVTVDATGLAAGDYEALLCVTTNDPANDLVEVPVSLTVEEVADPPEIDVDPESFSVELNAGGTALEVLTISNLGGDDLTWEIDTAEVEGGGDIVEFPDINFTPNPDFTGGSVQWSTGDTCDCDTTPFDFNIWANGGDLAFFWPGTLDRGGVSLDGGTTYAVLEPGDTIGPASEFIVLTAATASANWRQAGGVDGYLGFRFVNPDTSEVNFGYVRITTTGATGHPATVVGWAYNQVGDPIAVGEGASGCNNPDVVSWLSVDPDSGTTTGGDFTDVEVEVDSTGLAEGIYEALLCVSSNDPVNDLVSVPVTLTVSDPTAGTLEGTVTSAGHCSADPHPIEGAEVSVPGYGPVFTEADGSYSMLISEDDSPVDVTVTAGGYLGDTATGVVITAGMTTVEDFDLVLDAPCATVDPDSLAAEVGPDGITSQTLTVGNVDGGADLNWSIDEAVPANLPPTALQTFSGEPSGSESFAGGTGALTEGTGDLIVLGDFQMSQTSDTNIVPSNSAGCPTGPNHLLRRFYFDEHPGVGNEINSVDIGIQEAGSSTSLTVNIYTLPSGTPVDTIPVASLNLIGTASTPISAANDGTVVTVPVTGTVSDTGAFDLVVEAVGPGSFFIGATNTGETHPGFIMAPNCGATAPQRIDQLGGFETTHIIMVVNASLGGGCAAPEDVPWLSVAPDSGATPAGGTSDVTVSFDAAGLATGDYEALLCLNSDDPVNPQIEVPVTLTVLDQDPAILAVDPDALDFGDVAIGAMSTMSFDVSNDAVGDAADLTLTAIDAGGDAEFSVSGGDCIVGSVLEPGESCTVEVTFAPGAEGVFSGDVTVEGNGQMQVVTLSGMGVELDPGVLELSPSSLGFGTVNVGDTETGELTLTNTGVDTAAVLVSDILVSGGAFSDTGNGTCEAGVTELDPGESCTIEIAFLPADEISYAGSVVVDGAGDKLATATLSGTGGQPDNDIFSDRFEE